MLHQSYVMFISKIIINVSIAVDLDVTVSQVEYRYEVLNIQRTRAERSEFAGLCTYSFMYTDVIYSITVMEMVENNKMKRPFCLIVVEEFIKV